MIRTLLLASAFALASPALAQQTEAPADPATSDVTTSAEPTAAEPMAEPTAPTEAAPAQAEAAPAQDSVAEAAPAAPAQTAAAQPTATAQVAQVVEADFPSYDTDKNGELSATEFAAWMTKLKAAAAPAGATAAADPAWTGKAFAQADTDKSKTVSKVELTTFLSG